MKDYVIKICKNITYVINIKKSNTMYQFTDVSKIIVDNLGQNKIDILKLIKMKYDVNYEKLSKDYDNFVIELDLLNIKYTNIENIVKIYNEEYLKNASIEILNSCSFMCDHCYISKNKKSISMSNYKKIINQLVQLNCEEILITGGEPMLHKNFVEMYLYAKKMGLLVSINSNIYLLNNKILNVLSAYPPKVIEISIYGIDNETYLNFTHISNAFSIVDSNIKKLINKNINVNLKTVLTKKSKNYIYQLKEYAEKLNVNFRFDYIIFPNQDKIQINKERCLPEEIIDVLKKDNEIVSLFKHKVATLNKNIHNNNNNIFQCSIGSNRIFISCNLDLRPCLVVPFNYNLKNINIKDAYNNFKKIINYYKFSDNNKCRNCYKKSICRYCPGRFYMDTGNYEIVPKFYCELADKIIQEFGKI